MEQIAHTPKQLALILRGQRGLRQLTQGEAGGRVRLLTKTVSKLENQPENSTIESLFKMLSALDLELVVRAKSDGTDRPELEW